MTIFFDGVRGRRVGRGASAMVAGGWGELNRQRRKGCISVVAIPYLRGRLLILKLIMRRCHGFGTPAVPMNFTVRRVGRAEPVLAAVNSHGFGPPIRLNREVIAWDRRPEPVA